MDELQLEDLITATVQHFHATGRTIRIADLLDTLAPAEGTDLESRVRMNAARDEIVSVVQHCLHRLVGLLSVEELTGWATELRSLAAAYLDHAEELKQYVVLREKQWCC